MTPDDTRASDAVGQCRDCLHHRVTGNRKGSRFYLCGLAKADPRYPKYPQLPVIECEGYEPGGADPWEQYAEDTDEELP